jgi:SAM-dependent methyltransferase
MSLPKSCPICQSETAMEPSDHEYRRCQYCGTLRTKHDYNGKMYSDSYVETYLKYAKTTTNIPLQLCRLGIVSRWLHPQDRILDVGCCIGEFIRFAEKYYICEGFEPNERALEKKHCNAMIYTELTGMIHSANCITMFDVVEHLQQPKDFLNNLCHRYLKPQGTLVITTPDLSAGSWHDATLRKWKHYKPEEHLFLYTEKGIEILLGKIGLRVLHIGHEESDIRPGNPSHDILTVVARKITTKLLN